MINVKHFHAATFWLVLASCGALYAADAAPPGQPTATVDTEAECRKVKDLQLPAGDVPTKQQLDGVGGCDAEHLYYDARANPRATQADWEKVRVCAVGKDNNAVMMMLYANGLGVKFNRDLAIKYACAGNEMFVDDSDLITNLMAMQGAATSPKDTFDVCAFAAITPAVNRCAGLREVGADGWRTRKLDEFSHHLSKVQNPAFESLRQAAASFAVGRGNEVDEENLGGSGRVSFTAAAGMEEGELFLKDIEQCEQGEFPHYTLAQFAELDKQINDVYRKSIRASKNAKDQSGIYPGVSRETLKNTQRDWLKFRDAWVAFGKLRYPSVPAHAWQAMLTERRINQLQDMQWPADVETGQ